MYCINCGKKLSERANFCPACGAQVKYQQTVPEEAVWDKPVPKQEHDTGQPLKNIHKPVKKRSPKKAVITLCLALVVLIGAGIACLTALYNHFLDSANDAITTRDFDAAIELTDKAIQINRFSPKAYLLRATAYVENGDLYAANTTLQSGREKTMSKELDDVRIWGPTPDFEIAFWSSECPIIRQQYRFFDNSVQGAVSAMGRTIYVNTYYFDQDGHLAYSTVQHFQHSCFGADFAILDPYSGYSFLGDNVTSIQYQCDETGKVMAVSEERTGENIAKITYHDNDTVVGFGSNCVTIRHMENGHVQSISNTEDNNYVVTYQEDGSYEIAFKERRDAGTLKFDINGLMVAYEVDDPDAFHIESDNKGNIIRVTDDEGNTMQSYQYDAGSSLLQSATYFDFFTVSCTYNDAGKLIRLDYESDDGEYDGTYRDIEYDDDGQIIKMYQYSDNDALNWSAEYYYEPNSYCIVTLNSEVYVLRYFYSENGMLTDFSYSSARYTPGTYTGSAAGSQSTISVSVTVDYDSILSVEVDGHGETPGVGTKALAALPDAIVSANTTNVDGTSGATLTSTGLKNAVNDALKKAKISD